MYITDVSIRRPVVAWVFSLILVVFGIFVFSKLPVRELPAGLQPPVVQIKVDYKSASAVIVDEEVIVYSAPFLNQAIEQSVFYRGNKVKIHQKTDVWIEVSTFDGRKGWIQAQDVRNLY